MQNPSTSAESAAQGDDSQDGSECTPPSPKRSHTDSVQNSHDLARYVGRPMCLSDAEKYGLLTNPFRPGADYKFPKSTTGRALSFQHRWMQLHPWLAYSEQRNGGFCTPCVLFATSGYHGSDPGILVQRPLVSFSKALEVLSKHGMKDYHKAAVVRADEFVQVMSNEKTDICSQMNHAMADRVASNRQKLASIIKTIIFCGRQNIGLRGHRDNAIDLEKKPFVNHGNFLALLQFRIDAGDNILKEHLATSSRSATYTSSTIQNQVIDIICHQIQHIIFDKVKRCVQTLVLSHHCLVDAVVKFIAAMYLQTLLLHTTVVLFLSLFWTTCLLRWNLGLARTSRMLFLVSHSYHQS